MSYRKMCQLGGQVETIPSVYHEELQLVITTACTGCEYRACQWCRASFPEINFTILED